MTPPCPTIRIHCIPLISVSLSILVLPLIFLVLTHQVCLTANLRTFRSSSDRNKKKKDGVKTVFSLFWLPLSDHSDTMYSFNKCFAIDICFTFDFSCPYSSGLPYGKLANVPFFVGQKQKEKRRCKNRLFSFLAPPVRPFGYDVFL